MQPLTFVHAADLHLDTPFLGLEGYGTDLAQNLRDASLDAFDRLMELCLREKAAFLLLSGDLYDGAERGLRAQLRLEKGLRRLADAGIRTFIIHGNHDPELGRTAITAWPDMVHVFGPGEVGVEPVELNGERCATVYGISYGQRVVTENLALRYQARRVDEPGVHIAMLHGMVGTVTDHASYAPCSMDDLLAGRMDYWALGHIHKRQILHDSAPWVVYPGNLQGRSPKPAESGAKGAFVVQVVQGIVQEPRFVPLDLWRFENCAMDVSDVGNLSDLARKLKQAAQQISASNDNRGLLLRAVLTGAGQLVYDLRRNDNLEVLLKDLRDERQPRLWWTRVLDEMVLPHDRATLLERTDFIGAVVRETDDLKAHPERALEFLLLNLSSTQRDLGLLHALTNADVIGLLGEAEVVAVQLLRDQRP